MKIKQVDRVDSLTPEQVAKFPEWVKKWVDIGLSTEPADFDMATDAALKAYKLCNLKKPMVILRVASPYAATVGGAYAWMLLREFFKDTKTNVLQQVWQQVKDQVGQQVKQQVWQQLWQQVWAQVRHQVSQQVWQVWQVGQHVSEQVWDQVWQQVRDQVWQQVRDQVWQQVKDQVGQQVKQQVWQQLWDQVWQQVGQQVGQQVWQQVRQQVRDQVWKENFKAAKDGFNNDGISHGWAGFNAWVNFFREECGLKLPIKFIHSLEINDALVKSCGWTWWHENVLAISDRPMYISRDDRGRLHNETRQAIEYRDGWGFCSWHGVRIPSEWILEKQKLTAEKALKWENIEQRRAACEIVTWAKILKQLDAKIINKHESEHIGTLLEVNIPDSGTEKFLRVLCGTGREFAIPVPTEMKTAQQANAWTFGLDEETFNPEVRT